MYYRQTGAYTLYIRTNRALPTIPRNASEVAGYVLLDGKYPGGSSFEAQNPKTHCYEYVGNSIPGSQALRHPRVGQRVSVTLVIYRSPEAVWRINAKLAPEPALQDPPTQRQRFCGVR